MADTQTTNLGLIKFETGSRQGTWATSFAAEMDKIDAAFGSATAVSSTGASVTADDTYMQKAARVYSGVLVSDYLVTIPDGRARVFFVDNQMTVATFQLKFKHASTSAVVIPPGRNMVACDGTNIRVMQGFDINSQTVLTAPDTADSLALYDASASALVKISITNFFKVIDTIAALTAPDIADELVLYDASGTAAFKMTLGNLFKVINTLSALTAPDQADVLALYDTSGAIATAITVANFLKVINTLTTDATPDGANDFLLSYDTSAAAAKKITPSSIAAMASAHWLLYDTVNQGPITGGARLTTFDAGTKSSGTFTPDPGNGPHQKYTNNGAHTLAPDTTNTGDYFMDITNGASAGAITTSGWTKVSGDSFTTTSGNKFRCGCSVNSVGSSLVVLALQ